MVHPFGGPSIFRKTRSHLEVFRWALVTHQLDRLPFPMDLQKRERGGQRRYSRKPDSNDDWVSWWAPDMFSAVPFEPTGRQVQGIGALCRFPAGGDEDAYFAAERGE